MIDLGRETDGNNEICLGVRCHLVLKSPDIHFCCSVCSLAPRISAEHSFELED